MLASSEFKPSPGVFAKGLDVISQKNVTKMIISILSILCPGPLVQAPSEYNSMGTWAGLS